MTTVCLAAWRLPRPGQIGSDQLAAVVRATSAAMLCGFANTAIVGVSLWSVVPHGALSAWLLFSLLMTGGLFLRRGTRSIRETPSLSRRALRRSVVGAGPAPTPGGQHGTP
jgi:hypothetical protein